MTDPINIVLTDATGRSRKLLVQVEEDGRALLFLTAPVGGDHIALDVAQAQRLRTALPLRRDATRLEELERKIASLTYENESLKAALASAEDSMKRDCDG